MIILDVQKYKYRHYIFRRNKLFIVTEISISMIINNSWNWY